MRRYVAALTLFALRAMGQDAPTVEPLATGSLDVGYRWVSDISGNREVYRSTVNLGEGVRLLGADFTVQDPTKRLFDSLSVRGLGWGGDPYTTASAVATKDRIYRLRFDYRNIAYYNAIPSFANPFSEQGVFFNQRAFDTQRRMLGFDLELRPGASIVPYLSYSRNSERGSGLTDYVTDTNEFAVANLLRSHTDHYRGGVQIRRDRWSLTLEEGATVFKDDQQTFETTRNPGNRRNPFLGRTLYLDTLRQQYGIRGTAPYSRAVLAGSPFSWLNVQGQFLYRMGRTETNYREFASGQLATINPALFYSSSLAFVNGLAKQPHTSATVNLDVRPFSRVRIVENWATDRLHTASSYVAGGARDRFIDNYNQHALDVLYDVTKFLTLRAGHRYIWGDTTVRAPLILESGPQTARLKRPSAILGASGRWGTRLTANIEYEVGSADGAYYRTSLRDYHKVTARARYQVLSSLSVSWNLNTLDNDFPAPGVDYRFRSRANGAAIEWLLGERLTFLADYARTEISSSILYRVPQTFRNDRFPYHDDAHQASAQLTIGLPKKARLTAGGTLFASSGSRPTHFYRPLVALAVPIGRGVMWTGEWRWNGFHEPFLAYEDFRAHQFTTGLKITR